MAAMQKNEGVFKSVDGLKEEAIGRASAAYDAAQREAAELQEEVTRRAAQAASTFAAKLKAAGVDTDVMVEAAKDQAGALQRYLASEVKNRPVRALGVAAALGLVVGLLSSR